MRAVFPPDRLAVSALFLMNGFLVGSWAPKIPEFKARFDLSEGELGLMIVVFGVGSLILMPLAGAMIARRGSSAVVKALAVLCAPMLLWVTLAPVVWVAACVVFLLGGVIGGMDVAMNANAVAVERGRRRAIMSSCHGFWSLGGLIGAGLGGVAIQMAGVMGQAVFVTLVATAVLAFAWRHIRLDGPAPGERARLRLPTSAFPYLVGLMALFSMIPEGAVLDWAALYLRQEMAADVAASGLAFGAFSATMATVRFLGDPIRERLGAVRTLRLSAGISICGMVAAGLATDPAFAIVGFAAAGIGIANMVPIAFSAAGNAPGLAPGIGLSVVTTMGYAGILFAPSVIGFVAEFTSFSRIFTFLPVLFLVVVALSRMARHADFDG